jgi:SNF2 family DNA or RNA helicase
MSKEFSFFGPKPMQHQLDALEFVKDKPNAALFMEMGTGKSRVAIDYIRYHSYFIKRVRRTLIVCPKIAMWNWYNEIKKFSRLSDVTTVLEGSQHDKIKALCNYNNKVFIINYDAIYNIASKIIQSDIEILIMDESQRVKNFKAKRTKASIAIRKSVQRCLLLSGSPLLNSPLDIFSQFMVLDKGETFGANYFSFRNTYMEDLNAKFKQKGVYYPNFQAKVEMLADLQEKITKKSFIKKKVDCLDLPEKVYQTIVLELDGEQKRLYKEMKKEMITYFLEHPVVASIAITKMMRLSQITSGFVKTDIGEEYLIPDSPKILAIKEIIEDLPDNTKIIIWAWFTQNIEELKRELCQYNPAVLYGAVSDAQKRAEQDRFNNDPNCRVCIANQQSAGLAINLVAASYVIYYSQTFNLEHRIQSEDRCHRIGSEIHDKITYIDLVFKKTIDEVVTSRLKGKKELSEYVISDIVKEVLEC